MGFLLILIYNFPKREKRKKQEIKWSRKKRDGYLGLGRTWYDTMQCAMVAVWW